MKRLFVLAFLLTSVARLSAQEQTVTLEDLAQSAQQWAREKRLEWAKAQFRRTHPGIPILRKAHAEYAKLISEF